MKYYLVYLHCGKMVLTKKSYAHWKEIENEYGDYMTSLEFVCIEDLIDFISCEFHEKCNDISQTVRDFARSEETEMKLK